MSEKRASNKSRVLSGAEIVWECLIEEGVEVLFGYPGGANLPIYDAHVKYSDRVHHVLTRHEQNAAHAADGYARASGKVGVALATSGPGATNLITGVATAMMDSIPMVCISGQVGRASLGSDAFQETDILGAMIPLTKHSYQVNDITKLAGVIKDAFYIARSGRPGPVLVDIPKDVQNETTEFVYPEKHNVLPGYNPTVSVPMDQLIEVAKMIQEAKNPVILAGHGVLISDASTELAALAEKADIPVSVTLLGIGGIPASHPKCIGFMGMHGAYWANHAIQKADLLIACGMRFDDRVTGKLETYSPNSKKVHIDIDPTELNKNVMVDVPIRGDLKTVLAALLPMVKEAKHDAWSTTIKEWMKISHTREILHRKSDKLFSAFVIRDIWEATKGNALVVTDVGQHQMTVAQYYYQDHQHSLLTSGGLGTMGYGLPAAIGASFAGRDKDIWLVVGDGGIQMTINELATAVQENVNINIALINNGYLGMVRQWQEMFYDKRFSQTPISSPDFLKLTEAYGLKGYRVSERKDVIPTVLEAQAHRGPTLIEFVVEEMEMVYPMVAAGADLDDMHQRPLIEEQFSDMEV
ncbi:MAG: biosynthetic-type acetolactate synthase large subunit [Candidatus Marinimicrobia bacterium]|nr:biosynthetic-type acetolactate synthase large subunit [Candidatus Neomarinimicrobiota bacterium]